LETYHTKIRPKKETMLLELFNQVCMNIASQLCKTVLKLGKPRLNKT